MYACMCVSELMYLHNCLQEFFQHDLTVSHSIKLTTNKFLAQSYKCEAPIEDQTD